MSSCYQPPQSPTPTTTPTGVCYLGNVSNRYLLESFSTVAGWFFSPGPSPGRSKMHVFPTLISPDTTSFKGRIPVVLSVWKATRAYLYTCSRFGRSAMMVTSSIKRKCLNYCLMRNHHQIGTQHDIPPFRVYVLTNQDGPVWHGPMKRCSNSVCDFHIPIHLCCDKRVVVLHLLFSKAFLQWIGDYYYYFFFGGGEGDFTEIRWSYSVSALV